MAGSLQFSDLCRMFEEVSKRARKKRYTILKDFMDKLRTLVEQAGDPQEKKAGLYPVARLMLPSLDRGRASYGVKENKLAKRYVRVLCLPAQGEDAKRLLNYRAPSSNHGTDLSGDFAAVACHVLQQLIKAEPSKLTVRDVNQHLDQLAQHHAAHDNSEMDKVLENLLRTTSVFEQKWLIRILLKHTKFGVGRSCIFRCIHPDAEKLFDVCNNLESVCEKLLDPARRLNEVAVSIGMPFAPMLADRADIGKLGKFFTAERDTLLVETKLDGERVQIHREFNGRFRYFSRNGFDYTVNFGATSTSGSFTPRLSAALATNVSTFIIDGEMMAWNKAKQRFRQKGQNVDVKYLAGDGDTVPCFCVFDILYFNSEVLTNKPLSERLDLLKNVFQEKSGVIIHTPRWLVKTEGEIRESLNRAIDKQDEGIMLKDPQSVYRPSERKAGWWKVKPEYNDALMEHLDVIILGGFWGGGKRGGVVSQFLLGVAVSPTVPGSEPSEFVSLSRVGSGYTRDELDMLMNKLRPHWQEEQPHNVLCSGTEKPDVWIKPAKSVILEVKACEIAPSSAYRANCTLRFPRVQTARFNLCVRDCLTTARLAEIRNMAAGKLATKHATGLTGPAAKKRRTVRRKEVESTLAPQYRPADVSNVSKESNVLRGKEICVFTGSKSGHSKQDLEKLIAQHGGTIVQNPGNNTWACLAHSLEPLRVRNYVMSRERGNVICDVVLTSWLLGLVQGLRPVTPEPMDMIYSSPDTCQRLAVTHDQFGDSYTQPATRESLNFILKNWKAGKHAKPTQEQMWELHENLFEGSSLKSSFRHCLAYFDQYTSLCRELVATAKQNDEYWSLELVKKEFKFFGGRVTSCFDPTEVTHVIVHSRTCANLAEILSARTAKHMYHVVNMEWVTESRARGYLLPERDFSPDPAEQSNSLQVSQD